MSNKQLAIVIALIVNDKKEILLCKRHQPEDLEVHNKWEFPGGKIEFGEEPEEAVTREAKEETGVDVKVKRLLPKIYTNTWQKTEQREPYQVIILSYECEPLSNTLLTSDPKISEVKYVPLNKVDYENCLPKMKEIINLLNS